MFHVFDEAGLGCLTRESKRSERALRAKKTSREQPARRSLDGFARGPQAGEDQPSTLVTVPSCNNGVVQEVDAVEEDIYDLSSINTPMRAMMIPYADDRLRRYLAFLDLQLARIKIQPGDFLKFNLVRGAQQ